MASSAEHGRRATVGYAAALGLALVGFFVLRATQGFEYPTPWPDEGSFLWQAINFADYGSLFAPELNPTRHILWMPPGYMVLTGAIFSVTGFSLELARLLSGVFIAGAVLSVAYMLRRSRVRIAHAVVLAVFLASPVFQLAANTARMEPLVLLVASGAFCLISSGAMLAGASIGCLAPLVHPNGFFPAAAAVLFIAAWRAASGQWPRVRRREIWVAVLSALAWGAYAIYAFTHLEEWLVDLRGQLDWKQAESTLTGGFIDRLTAPECVVLYGGWIAVCILLWRFCRRSGQPLEPSVPIDGRSFSALLGLAGAFVLQTLITVGWMYEVYAAFAYALVTCIALELATARARRLPAPSSKWAVAGAASVGILVGLVAPRRPFLMRSVVSSAAFPSNAPRYFTEQDHRAVENALRKLASWHGPLVVQFVPESDALLFVDLRGERLQFLQQTRYDGVADMVVYHDSVWIPHVVRRMNVLRMAFQQEIPIPVPKWPVIHQRDSTERWHVYRRHRE